MIRHPVVAGRFYPGDPAVLAGYLSEAVKPPETPTNALGVMAPHAGYVYSGATAAAVLAQVAVPPTVLLLGPNHTGRGTAASIMSSGEWETPLGSCRIDEPLAQFLKTRCDTLVEDDKAHEYEHSLEVMLPFLLHRRPDVKIVPIAFMLRNAEAIETTGRRIGLALREWGEPVLMVASSDMTHYETAKEARRKDALAIERVLALDPLGLMRVVGAERITMCGVVPTAVMLYAALEMGAKSAANPVYTNSGEVSGDFSSVVGYAGIIVE